MSGSIERQRVESHAIGVLFSEQRDPIFDPNVGYMIPVGPLNFTTSEKALVAFLKTRGVVASPPK